jgi:hypothetical protein
VQTVKAPPPGAVVDVRSAQAEAQQLRDGDDAVLSKRHSRDRQIEWWGTFS